MSELNKKLKEGFKLLILQYQKQLKDTKDKNISFKLTSARKTLKILDSITYEITSGDQLKDIKGIGAKTIEKIEEILSTGTLNKLKDFEINNDTTKENELKRITGIGPAKAKKLVEAKIYLPNLKLLLKKNKMKQLSEILTHHQIIGLKYLDEIEQRIPYKEIQQIETYLLKFTKLLDKNLNLVICGSYRRKKQTSGDIDILLYHTKKNEPEFLTNFIDILKQEMFLVDDLTTQGETKYMGICRFTPKGIARRIDIRYIQKKHAPTSILYFTGSGEFNKNMRLYANKKGFKLNEYGLFKLKKDKSEGLKMKTNSEQDIFTLLDLPYILPENRTELVQFK